MLKGIIQGAIEHVSLTSVLGQIMEQLTWESLNKIEVKNIIGACQHCFWELRSCQTNLVLFWQEYSPGFKKAIL